VKKKRETEETQENRVLGKQRGLPETSKKKKGVTLQKKKEEPKKTHTKKNKSFLKMRRLGRGGNQKSLKKG